MEMNMVVDSRTAGSKRSRPSDTNVYAKAKARAKAKAKAKKTKKATTTTHPQFIASAQSIFTGIPLGPPTFPYIRSLVPSPLPSLVLFHDRTYTEWMALCRDWANDRSGSPTIRGYADLLWNAFYRSQRARWLVRCYLRRLRMRIAKRRSSIEDDLVTCSPIPPSSAVAVYDFRNRSYYTFHSMTILTMIVNALRYFQYGIASPMLPKNPYTNLPWNTGQLTSLVAQCGVVLMNTRHRLLPPVVVSFRGARYSIPRFHRENDRALGLDAAVRFFSQHEDPDMRYIYGELLDDLYVDLLNEQPLLHWRHLKTLIKQRRLPGFLQKQWDHLIMAVWIYDNLRVFYDGYRSYYHFIEDMTRLHVLTVATVRKPGDIVSVLAVPAVPVVAVPIVAVPAVVNSLVPQ